MARLGAWSAAEALPGLLTGVVTARAIDDGFLAGRPGIAMAWLAGLAVVVVVGALGSGRSFHCVGELVEPFRDQLAQRVVSGALHRSTSTGARPDTAAVSRFTQQLEIVRDTLAGLVITVRGFLFTAGAALLGLLSLDPMVAALVAAPLLLSVALFAAAIPTMARRQREFVHAGERLGEAAAATFAGQRDVVACGAQPTVAARVGELIDAQAQAERTLARMAALRSVILAIGGWLPIAVLLLAVPWLTSRGLTPGEILGSLVYVSTGLQPALHTLVQGVADGGLHFAVTLDRLLSAAPQPPLTPPTPPPRLLPAPRPRPAVELRGVVVRYGPHARPVLDHVDLTLPPGDHVAVVGPSGVGKSTLAAVAAGLLRPQHGSVRLAGVPVDRLDPPTLARLRVLVPQEAYVFTGTLGDNLRYLRPSAADAEIRAAIEALGMWPLLCRLGGLRSMVYPATLSAGERQLIAAVRAYLAAAPLVILDEATSHLDPATEARVEAAFAARPGTLVVIAHRLSSALRARRILILDDGRPVIGTHDELVAGSAAYRDLLGYGPETSMAPIVR
ncbi:MAG TPA: ABC transporter ATP-binding protein [Micromonospora sp.]